MAAKPLGSSKVMSLNDISSSRLWAGVPDWALKNINMYDPAFQGHTFLFVTHMPQFMKELSVNALPKYSTLAASAKSHIGNLQGLIERASTAFNGTSAKTVNFAEQTDGYSDRKLNSPVSVTKDIDEVTIRMHEFKGLVLKHAIEFWVDGMFDIKSKHASYYGLIQDAILEFSLQNHTMGVLVVQTDPGWLNVQEAAWFQNMIPVEVPFESFHWEKGDNKIIDDYDCRFKCNEERSDVIDAAAVSYMQTRIVDNINTKYFDRYLYDPSISKAAVDETIK
jgi:hypothetical protein